MKFKKFKARFVRRVMTRFHMSLILTGTIVSGILFSKFYLHLGMEGLIARYLLVLVSAYGVFFLLIKLWLVYLTKQRSLAEDILDAVDIPSDLLNHRPGEIFAGGGGDYGGGGASGGWDTASAVTENIASSAESVAETIGEGVADAAGEAVSGLADEGAVVLIPLAILLLVLFGTGVYLIYAAPAILTEAAFEFLLASSLIRSAKRMDDPDWMGSVFRATWMPLAVTALAAVILAAIVSSYCPSAVSIREAFDYCR